MGLQCLIYGDSVLDKIFIFCLEILEFLRFIYFFKQLDKVLKRIMRVLSEKIMISINSLKFYITDLHSIYILTPFFESRVWDFLKLRGMRSS